MKDPIRKFYEFLDRPIQNWARIVIVLLCIPAGFAIVKPLWRISMEAPQYPRGLSLDIYSYSIVGGHDGKDLNEVNELNHYIGMKTISTESIPDLGWMPFAIGVLILLAVRVGAIGNVRALIDLAVLNTYVLGFLGARFIYKLYVYGHDLDPTAAVTIEPFMPVVIGTKEIANFTTHGAPLIGTYLLGAFVVGISGITLWHLFSGRRDAARAEKPAHVGAVAS